MKKHFYLFLISLCLSIKAIGVNIPSDMPVVVNDSGSIGFFSTIPEALAAAGPGAVITLKDGIYPGFTLNRSDISIIGTGMKTRISGTLEFDSFSNVNIEGLNIEQINWTDGAKISNLYIKGCLCLGISFNFSCEVSSTTYDRCYLSTSLWPNCRDIDFHNCFLYLSNSSYENNTELLPENISFYNCQIRNLFHMFFCDEEGNPTEENPAIPVGNFTNCIIRSTDGVSLHPNSVLDHCEYCLPGFNGKATDCWSVDENNLVWDIENLVGKGYLGTDGSLIGPYGGLLPVPAEYTEWSDILRPSLPSLAGSVTGIDNGDILMKCSAEEGLEGSVAEPDNHGERNRAASFFYWFDNDFASGSTSGQPDRIHIPANIKTGPHKLNICAVNPRGEYGPVSSHSVILPDASAQKLRNVRYCYSNSTTDLTYDHIYKPEDSEIHLEVDVPDSMLPFDPAALMDIDLNNIQQLMAVASLINSFKHEGESVRLDLRTETPIFLEMQTLNGEWTNPLRQNIIWMGDSKPVRDMTRGSSITFEKAPYDSFEVIRFKNMEEGQLTLTASQPSTILLFEGNIGASLSKIPTVISSNELLKGAEINFKANTTYHALVVGMSITDFNPGKEITFSLSGADPIELPAPTIDFSHLELSIDCDDREASIWYTTDNSDPKDLSNSQRTEYHEPLHLTDDCTVRAYASREGDFIDSPETSFKFLRYDYTMPMPELIPNVEEESIRIVFTEKSSVDASDHVARAEFSGSGDSPQIINNLHNGDEITVDHGMDMSQLTVVLTDASGNNFDSPARSLDIHFCEQPVISHDGRRLHMSGSGEISLTNLTTGIGGGYYSGSYDFDYPDLGTLCAVAHNTSDATPDRVWFNSSPAILEVNAAMSYDYGLDICTVRVNENGLVKDAFKWCGNPDSDVMISDFNNALTNIKIIGALHPEDFETLRPLSSLSDLDLSQAASTVASIPENALAGSGIWKIMLPKGLKSAPGFLKDCKEIREVFMLDVERIPSDLLASIENPNTLIYVADKSSVPSYLPNVVVVGNYPYDKCRAENLALTDKMPFFPTVGFEAAHASFTKEFAQTTPAQNASISSSGWSSVWLPFTPDRITHEEKGECHPFADGNHSEAMLHFWLFGPSEDSSAYGWVASPIIRPYMPYIISMPNNPDYLPRYNLAGKVTFSASDVAIESFDWVKHTSEGYRLTAGIMLHSNYFRGATTHWGETALSLNEGIDTIPHPDGTRHLLPGEAFVEGLAMDPFSIYLTDLGGRKAISVFDSSLTPRLNADRDLAITVGRHTLRLLSQRDRIVRIFNAEGIEMRCLMLHASEPATVTDLPQGIYIVEGIKVRL